MNHLSAEKYLSYVSRGPCEFKEKIRNDTFRTLATDRGFKERVREDMLVRLLDAFVWRDRERQERAESLGMASGFGGGAGGGRGMGGPSLTFTYVQGMNVLAAPFLYTMPSELDAFFCFSRFIEYCCPLYVQQTLDGVHRGLKVRLTLHFVRPIALLIVIYAASRSMSQNS